MGLDCQFHLYYVIDFNFKAKLRFNIIFEILLLLEWLYSPCGPSPLFSFLIYSIHNRQDCLNEWSAHRKASTYVLDGNWPIILLRGPLGAWGSLTCSKFTTLVKQLKVPPWGLVPWIFPSLKIRRPPPGHSSHEVGTLPLDYGGRYVDNINCYYFPHENFLIFITLCFY
jgi:hypothetical protein